ncbi:hypothetical protein GA0070607_2088 [Micromonospora coriariae]|uniref:Uncharacterized protein n=1 Tax=Micromonospora coriariae TaxID=285665 RepID=A0A1C4VGD5_9ACTN|nr:hypothetical protein GA0070607_2088 [Micromonospora coriariae]
MPKATAFNPLAAARASAASPRQAVADVAAVYVASTPDG